MFKVLKLRVNRVLLIYNNNKILLKLKIAYNFLIWIKKYHNKMRIITINNKIGSYSSQILLKIK